MAFAALLKFLLVGMFATIGVNAAASQLQQVTNFGTNPTGVQMFVYRPPNVAASPALIIAMHYCTGTAQAFFQGTQLANLADQYGYIVIYPDAPDPGGCWDVHSDATLKHDAGGDSLAIASMVRYAIANYKVDATRVFATGTSSGAMMTDVLAGAYPDLFAAGSANAGVPYACFAGPNLWNNACATGTISKTPQQWGDLVRAGYPGYTGPRPRMQVWHGTADTTLSYNNFGEDIKQWTNVFGYSQTAASVQQNSPRSGWTRSIYGPNFQAISAQGVTHDIPYQDQEVLKWFGIIGGTTTLPPTTTPTGIPTTTPNPPVTTTTAAPGPQQTHWGQCGGTGWAGPTVCASPYTCVSSNQWYSQCL
ncbi:putative acetylxylan esterase A [Hypsizygus marmoreus]|uniref:Carboxylic ester hydrolase n=1 Tax=Hypsizygus marmoreus TaxID=39966 RepID=A0A369JVH3_HYPMA|nr:putative acetylxylan esterase A [Hypsizygus marmoreus]